MKLLADTHILIWILTGSSEISQKKEENATWTYDSLKDDYLSLKAILNVAGVNMTDTDKIKE